MIDGFFLVIPRSSLRISRQDYDRAVGRWRVNVKPVVRQRRVGSCALRQTGMSYDLPSNAKYIGWK